MSSCLSRCSGTAEIIAHEIGYPKDNILYTLDLNEVGLGDLVNYNDNDKKK